MVWDDDPENIVKRAKSIEDELMDLVWQTGEPEEMEDNNEKKDAMVTTLEIDPESGEVRPEHRSTNLLNTILVGFTMVIVTVMLGAGFREVAIETVIDHNYLRMAFLLLTPVQIFFTLVSNALDLTAIPTDIGIVLFPGHCRVYRSMHWPRSTNANEFQVLFSQEACASSKSFPTSCHDSVPSLQGRSPERHRANRQVHQRSHVDI